ncbi:serine protease inhibitor 2-like [Schistocerca gregaria]|uniref:serine protease inhibitor 2-like n=1 Tax=Schistocerca gregaria TaxID=7010 RepID=UPI00211EB774|nr:serine protease inhibitor 2-like [Schistocerca gregaria]
MAVRAFTVVVFLCGVLAVPPLLDLPPAEDPSLWDDDDYLPVSAGERFDAFDWALCRALDARYPGNVVVSPIGVKMVLAMLYEGATGDTARELEAGLLLTKDRQQTRDKYSAIVASLQGSNADYLFDLGNKVFADVSLTLRPRFVTILRAFYNSDIQNVDFRDPKTVPLINEWVKNATRGHIDSIMSEDGLSDAVLLLVNALYFKGSWKYQFQPQLTFTSNFYTGKGKTVTAQFMRQSAEFFYLHSKEINASILRLPYLGRKFSMFIVLPDDRDGLENLLSTVNPFALREDLGLLRPTAVHVVLPKFTFEFSVLLNDVLKELGIKQIFTDKANLQGIARSRYGKLSVSKVLQKSALEVNEKGTTAAAATGIEVIDRIGVREVTFNATHPFLFFIEDETTGTVIFVGKVVEPSTDKTQQKTTISVRQGEFHGDKKKDGSKGVQQPHVSQTEKDGPYPVEMPDFDITSQTIDKGGQQKKRVYYILSQSAFHYLIQFLPQKLPQ